MKKLIAAAIWTLCVIVGLLCLDIRQAMAISEAYIPSETLFAEKEIQQKVILEFIDIIERRDAAAAKMATAHQMANAVRDTDNQELNYIIELMQKEYAQAYKEYQYYNIMSEEYFNTDYWLQKKKEYPYATSVWIYLKNLGYNDYVCAGIMGNLMAECGGQTLDLQYWIYDNGYYGMCQWSKDYKEIWDGTLEEQCDFLRDTIQNEFKIFGYKYKEDFTYEQFLQLDNEKEAALAFSKVYERNAPQYCYIRTVNATKALKYYTGM